MSLISRLFSWWANEPLGTALFTRWKGERVGTDAYGNRYFQERGKVSPDRGRRRWVIYKGEVEASKVPPEWHAWLHHTVAAPPVGDRRRHRWEQPHVPNLTGTNEAWRPPGSLSAGARRPKATGDYEPWTPGDDSKRPN
ncbi:MAG: NADH:ubiquinone oxidoreductase subunit NDUFA12 [Alphaproteobacteria bacterium]|nr:NADH:ubiquinone oxidoreductase subunit NDUFA12 [Alphaproteobacteria bacterium]